MEKKKHTAKSVMELFKHLPEGERGGGNHTRGLSNELVWLPSSIDHKGKAGSRGAKLGMCSDDTVKSVLGGYMFDKAMLCMNGEASYHKFSKNNGNGLMQIKVGMGTVKGICHKQRLNAYYFKQKVFLASFKGVSSKYLNNYLTWNNDVGVKCSALAEKAMTLLVLVASALFSGTFLAFSDRLSLSILVNKSV